MSQTSLAPVGLSASLYVGGDGGDAWHLREHGEVAEAGDKEEVHRGTS